MAPAPRFQALDPLSSCCRRNTCRRSLAPRPRVALQEGYSRLILEAHEPRGLIVTSRSSSEPGTAARKRSYWSCVTPLKSPWMPLNSVGHRGQVKCEPVHNWRNGWLGQKLTSGRYPTLVRSTSESGHRDDPDRGQRWARSRHSRTVRLCRSGFWGLLRRATAWRALAVVSIRSFRSFRQADGTPKT